MIEQLIGFNTEKLAKEKGIEFGDITQSSLQKILRDKYKIFVYCVPKGFTKFNEKETIRWGNNIAIRKNKWSSTYEKALENGLIEALKTIKDKE